MVILKKIVKRKMNWVALPLVILILFTAAFAPFLSPHDPGVVNLEKKLLPPGGHHLLGTDHLGRDVLSRLIWGARISMGSAFLIISALIVISLLVGSISGYVGGAVDSFFMRLCELFLTFPTFILAMFFIGVMGTGLTNVILAITLTHWAWYARIIRSLVLSMKNREYILAARVVGTSHWRIFINHLALPVLAQLAILATLDIGHMMLHVSGLSFIGLGVQPPTPEWGVMINDARQYLWTRPELIMYPGIIIFIAVIAFNIVGDTFRDSLDPDILAEEA